MNTKYTVKNFEKEKKKIFEINTIIDMLVGQTLDEYLAKLFINQYSIFLTGLKGYKFNSIFLGNVFNKFLEYKNSILNIINSSLEIAYNCDDENKIWEIEKSIILIKCDANIFIIFNKSINSKMKNSFSIKEFIYSVDTLSNVSEKTSENNNIDFLNYIHNFKNNKSNENYNAIEYIANTYFIKNVSNFELENYDIVKVTRGKING